MAAAADYVTELQARLTAIGNEKQYHLCVSPQPPGEFNHRLEAVVIWPLDYVDLDAAEPEIRELSVSNALDAVIRITTVMHERVWIYVTPLNPRSERATTERYMFVRLERADQAMIRNNSIEIPDGVNDLPAFKQDLARVIIRYLDRVPYERNHEWDLGFFQMHKDPGVHTLCLRGQDDSSNELSEMGDAYVLCPTGKTDGIRWDILHISDLVPKIVTTLRNFRSSKFFLFTTLKLPRTDRYADEFVNIGRGDLRRSENVRGFGFPYEEGQEACEELVFSVLRKYITNTGYKEMRRPDAMGGGDPYYHKYLKYKTKYLEEKRRHN